MSLTVRSVAVHLLVAALATYAVDRTLVGDGGTAGSGAALVSASGATALAWSYAGLLLGLLVGTRLPRSLVRHRHRMLGWHRRLNLTVIGLMATHVAAFALGTPGASWVVALVPQTSAVSSFGYTLGVLSLYGAVVLGPSYYLRRRLGPHVWLVAHQLAALVYALALWHALALGPHVRVAGPWRVVVWVAQLPLLALFALRLWRPRRPSDRMDARLRSPRYRRPRYAVLRVAATSGVLIAAVVVLFVALSAIGPGLPAAGG
jgi:hypothetical protein